MRLIPDIRFLKAKIMTPNFIFFTYDFILFSMQKLYNKEYTNIIYSSYTKAIK